MTIPFACPGCDASFRVAADQLGNSAKCPKCRLRFLIPDVTPTGTANGGPVEIAPCPGCDRTMTVAAEDMGHRVQCLHCGTAVHAVLPGTAPAVRLTPTTRARKAVDAIPLAPDPLFDYEQSRRDAKPRRDPDPDRGELLLSLAILSWLTFGLSGVFVYFLANTDLEKMNTRRMTRSGRGLTLAAKVLVLIQFWLTAAAVILGGGFFGVRWLIGALS